MSSLSDGRRSTPAWSPPSFAVTSPPSKLQPTPAPPPPVKSANSSASTSSRVRLTTSRRSFRSNRPSKLRPLNFELRLQSSKFQVQLVPAVKNRIKDDPEAPERLTAPLRPEAEQDDVSLAERHIERDRLAREHVLAEQKAGGKHVLVRVAHQHRAVETLERLKCRATAEEHRRALRHPRGHALRRIDDDVQK